MSFHVVTGAGSIGTATALRLARSGERVRLVTRRGTGPEHPGIERIAADATDADALAALTEGATALINCAAPAYHRWPREFPPLAAALLTTAERTGAGYVMLGNLYGYGPVDGRFHEELPLAPTSRKGTVRARLWEDALAAHRAGRVRATEVRASDFLGPGAGSLFQVTVAPAVVAGDPVSYPADPDAPHSWSYTGDVAATLIAAARSEAAWGRVWHVPSTSEASARTLASALAGAAGAPAPKLTALSPEELAKLGEEDEILAEVVEMGYLYYRPQLLDSARTERELGVSATPLDEVLAETARSLRG
ncbi:NAD-dependent epimerase/dehydratase family protein [Streptomyces sp. CB01881]|uniref:NAD-dependent epimerase/dehydratase family protein n=1 Tax=Streptomyces sp. CB01881 TaxID=2078691 RepID=UPI000CDC894F|nr:NAD-dependent epimerase/dehydratase family protein [Streptomyces sp. CB01881]AUY52294.1 NAD-dependent epimerase [Streptomyces sp. CB01881]TYC71716.1 NAD-dependent epimerase/dehydratase family protein [Streptomyces sp. CB01881]